MEKNKKIEITKVKGLSIRGKTIMLVVSSLLFIVTGIFLFLKTNNDKQYYLETSAVITAIETKYEQNSSKTEQKHVVYVKYNVDGVLYENVKLPYYIFTMKERQTITINYDSRNPGTVVNSAKSSYIVSVITIVAGLGVFTFNIFDTKKSIKKEKQEEERINLLLSSGIVKRCVITFISMGKDSDFFECIVDGFEYYSPKIKHTQDLFTGCTVNIYFEKEGYEERISAEKRHSNYFIDLNSVEEGSYQEPKKLI